MKTWSIIALAFLAFSFSSVNPPEKIEMLSAKVILQNTNGYFVLSDHSCWKAVGFSTRWRSLSEWWNNVKLVPENFECVPNDWALGTEIEVYAKYENLTVNESDASNQETLKQCTHLMYNRRTGQVLFAIALHPVDCVVQLYNDSYNDGYNAGYSKGRSTSYQAGHDDGYRSGYADGYQTAQRQANRPRN
jgi:hypothetical protein